MHNSTDALTHLTHFPSKQSGEPYSTGNCITTGRTHRHGARTKENASGASGASDARALDTLAARVAALFFSFRDPEAFHVEKHDIACQLHRLAEAMRRGAA